MCSRRISSTMVAYVVLLCLAVTTIQLTKGEECPVFTYQKNIDYSKYSGDYIEIFHSPNLLYQCAKFTYNYEAGPPEQIKAHVDAVNDKGVKIESDNIAEIMRDPNNPTDSSMAFQTGTNKDFISSPVRMTVLKTDYTTFTVEYACEIADGKKIETLSAESRLVQPTLTKDQVLQVLIDSGVRKAGDKADDLINDAQKNC